MSWYNPLTWGGEAARETAESVVDVISDVLEGIYGRIRDNPKVVVAPVAGILGGITAYHAAKSAGQESGVLAVKKTNEYFEELNDEQNEKLVKSD